MITLATRLFPLWAVILAAAGYVWPAGFTPLAPWLGWLLGLVMFGMGLTLTPADFRAVRSRPAVLGLGLGLQYLVMPAAAFAVAWLLKLPPALAAGLILVGACPGGTASNVITYLARGDVALSVTLTALSTLLAVVATPWLTWLYAGQYVAVPATEMLVDIVRIVIAPVAAGVALNTVLGRHLATLKMAFPLLSVVTIAVIIAVVVALNRDQLGILVPLVGAAVALHNALGLIAGYGAGMLAGADVRTCRTLAIEVGMQNSGLGVALAGNYFAPAATLPGALFSIWHNLSGSALAAWWGRTPPAQKRSSDSPGAG